MVSPRSAVPHRARAQEDKVVRRDSFLAEAGRLFASSTFEAVKMSAVADGVGVAKGTLFLYFPTKESLFLALAERELDAWFDAIDASLLKGKRPWTAARATRELVASLEGRDVCTRLLALLHSVLEQNVSEANVRAFKQQLLARTQAAGSLLEERMPFVARGEGVRVLLHLHALVVGLRQMADPGPRLRAVLEAPELAPFRLEFSRELAAALGALLLGMERREVRVAVTERFDG